MGDYLDLIAGLGLFCAGVVALTVVISVIRARRLPLQRPARSTLSRSAFPAAEIALLDGERPRLEALGFVYRYSMATRKLSAAPGKDMAYADVYEHPGGTHAWVERSEAPEYGEPVAVSFLTGFADGTNHLTVNRYKHYLFGLPGEWAVFDDYLPDLERAFVAHSLRVREAGKAIEPDGLAMRERFTRAAPRMLAHLVRHGWIAPAREPERWRLTWFGALRVVLGFLRGAGRAARNRPKSAPVQAGVSAAAQPEALDRQYAIQKTLQWSKDDKRWLSGLSIVAFAAIGVWLWGWEFMLILLAVIGVHELGHFFAMRLVGYRNLHVFFVPGLGGLATGEKANATPFQKLFVYLAGPMPGIVVAVAVVIAFADGAGQYPDWVVPLLVVTLAINYLNLLPVTPLDGGRVVEVLLFAKVPVMRLAFIAACAAALLGAGLYMGDTVLAVIGGLVTLGLPHQWRIYRVERALPPREEGLDEARAKEAVFEACSRPEFSKWSFADRSAVANALVDEVQSRKPRRLESIAGLVIYAACLAGPAYALVEFTEFGEIATGIARASLSAPPGPDREPSPPPRDWAAEIARAKDLPARDRLALLLDAIDADHIDPADLDVTALPRMAWEIAQGLPAGDPLRGRSLLALANAQEDYEEQGRLARQVASEFEGALGKGRLILADALELLSWHEPPGDPLAATLALERAHAIRAEELPADDPVLARTRSELGRRWFVAGRRDEAGRLLETSAGALAKAGALHRVVAEADYAGYLAAVGRAVDAEARLQQFLAQANSPAQGTARLEFPSSLVGHRLLWIQLAQTGPDAAQRARATLRAIENDQRGAGGRRALKRNLRHQLDSLAVARATGDAKLEQEAREGAREAAGRKLPPGITPCTPFAPAIVEGDPWEQARGAAHARLLAELGICPRAG